MTDAVDFAQLEAEQRRLRADFAGASPYPHIVIDGFLHADVLAQVYDELDRLDESTWTKYLHLNERKYANTDPTQWGSAIERVTAALLSDRFVTFLEALSGFDDLIADPALDGGGLHRSTRGGFLNVHADFTAHHAHDHWRRRINLILYLNRDWSDDWGGQLELWSSDMQRCEKRVAPQGNRALIFETSDESFHGHPDPMTCPEGVARQSLALYYFTEEAERHIHSTNYQPRPDDGVKAVGIVLDRQALRLYDGLKRRLRLSDGAVSKLLGRIDRLRPGTRRRKDTS